MPRTARTLLAASVLFASLPAAAQSGADRDAAFAADLSGVRAAVAGTLAQTPMPQVLGAQLAAGPQRLLEGVLTAMNDGPATAGLLVSWLRENQAVVEFNAAAKDRASHSWDNGKPSVYLNESLAAEPASYRYTAVYVARETAELMLKDFPESAEKRYIVASRMAETFFELGGTRMTMGNIDGRQDPQAEQSIRLWVENDPVSGVASLARKGAATLPTLRTPAADAALKDFEAFKAQEKEWLWSNQGMLQ